MAEVSPSLVEEGLMPQTESLTKLYLGELFLFGFVFIFAFVSGARAAAAAALALLLLAAAAALTLLVLTAAAAFAFLLLAAATAFALLFWTGAVTATRSCCEFNLGCSIFTLAVIILDAVPHLVALYDAALALHKVGCVAEDVLASIIRLDEAKPFVAVPTHYLSNRHAAVLWRRPGRRYNLCAKTALSL